MGHHVALDLELGPRPEHSKPIGHRHNLIGELNGQRIARVREFDPSAVAERLRHSLTEQLDREVGPLNDLGSCRRSMAVEPTESSIASAVRTSAGEDR